MSKRQGNPTEFSNRLREMRRAANLTQVELAKKTELTYVYIGRLEKGISQPTADVIKRLAEGLGVTAGYLLDGSEPNVAGLEDQDLARQFQQLSRLPIEDKAIIKGVVEAFLFRRQVQNLSKESA
jgi:transcriptional regulator with XRE-family HTH domain